MSHEIDRLYHAWENHRAIYRGATFDRDGIGPNNRKPYLDAAKKAAKVIANKNYRDWFPKGEKITNERDDKFRDDFYKL
jgi:hypothetical protein